MTHPTQPTSLRAFTIVCIGQVATLLGSNMTSFAIIIWAWRLTGEATPLSLLALFKCPTKRLVYRDRLQDYLLSVSLWEDIMKMPYYIASFRMLELALASENLELHRLLLLSILVTEPAL